MARFILNLVGVWGGKMKLIMRDADQTIITHTQTRHTFANANVIKERIVKFLMRLLKHAEQLGLDRETLLQMPLIDAMMEIQNAEAMWKNLVKELPDNRG